MMASRLLHGPATRFADDSAMTTTPSAFGLYPSCRALHMAADALRSARFRQTDISIMYSDGQQAYRLRASASDPDVADETQPSLGGMLSSLSGVGAFGAADEGPFLVGGPMLALVSGGHALRPSLQCLGIPDVAVDRFAGCLKNGDLLLSVQCDDVEWTTRALDILKATGAHAVEVNTAAVPVPVRVAVPA
jgi:hypothetical protein